MKRVWILLAFLLLPLFLLYSLSSFWARAQDNLELRVREPSPPLDLPAFTADQIIVKFKPDAPLPAIEELKKEHGAKEIYTSRFGAFLVLSLPEGSSVSEKAEIFTRNPLVEYAHPNFFVQASFVPNDTFYSYQWHFDDDHTNNPGGATTNPYGGANGGGIRMEQAWDISAGNASVKVAVLDTGVAYENFSDPNPAGCYDLFGNIKPCRPRIDTYYQASDLAGTSFTIIAGSDLVNSDSHPNDDEGHGTHVTGTVAQTTNNGHGVAGIAFSTTIMPIKVLDANGKGLLSGVADGVYLATNSGAKVISMSLGTSADATALRDAVNYAQTQGVTVVAACGNSNVANCDYPGRYSSTIGVGATRYDETRSYYSSYGDGLDLVAPGGDVYVDQNGDGYGDGVLQQTFGANTADFGYWFYQGTSMATPHVAAVSALILALQPSYSPAQVKNTLLATTEAKSPASEYGAGLLDAYAALTSVAPAVSINLTTDGTTPFGILPLGATQDTTASGINDVQTVQVTTGPANLSVKSTTFSDGTNVWTLGPTSGVNQVKWDFSKDGVSWTTFTSADSLFTLDTNIAQGASRNLYLRLAMPTDSSSNLEHAATVTIVATAP